MFAVLVGALVISSANAATVAVLGGAPTNDGADISNLVTPSTTSDIINGDRAAAGQTFTTGSNAGGYEITSLTVYNTRGVSTSGGTWNFRLGTVSGTSFTEILSDSVSVAGNALSLSGTGGDWIRFTLTTPFSLSANTVYGVDIVRTGAGNFLTWGENADSNYTGGQSYTSPPNGTGGPTISLASNDRIFHVDMTAIPEPSVALLSGLGVMLLLRRRKH